MEVNVPRAIKAAIVHGTVRFAKEWRCFGSLPLTNNMRSIDITYSTWLLQLGKGELGNEDGLGEGVIEIPKEKTL